MLVVKLLENSQTFIGVLATIVILCVVTGSGNFLHTILKGIADPTRNKIQNFKNELNLRANSLREGQLYKKFQNLLSEISNTATYSSHLKNSANEYRVLYEVSVNELTNKFNSELAKLYNTIDGVQDSKEQTFAPLFVFGYCIIVFICDEIVFWLPGLLPLVVSVLAVFTILSVFFLFFLWRKFHAEFCPKSNAKVANYTSETAIQITYKNACFTFLCKTLLPFTILTACLWIVSFITPIPINVVRILILIGISLPLCHLGDTHTLKRKSLGKHSHSFLLWHFSMIFVLSICFSIILFIPADFFQAIRIPYSDKLWEIQFSIIIFSILFGMVIPFWVPYHCYAQIEQHAEIRFYESRDQMNSEIEDLEGYMRGYIRDLETLIFMDDDLDYESVNGADCCFEVMDIRDEL